jgi:hypothetical protein
MSDMEESGMTGESDGYDPNDTQAKGDADTLRAANEIRQDKPRHQKALQHLAAHAKNSRMASANEKRAFSRKTGQRMQAAFGKSGSSPFQKASAPDVEES